AARRKESAASAGERVRILRGSCVLYVTQATQGPSLRRRPDGPSRVRPANDAANRTRPGLRGLGGGLRGALLRRLPALRARAGLAGVLGDEALGRVAGLGVGALRGRRLHQVGAGAVELAGDAVVEGQLQAAHGVDDDARRVRRVPDLELELRVE